jgi:hypothetical protein
MGYVISFREILRKTDLGYQILEEPVLSGYFNMYLEIHQKANPENKS